MNNLNQGKKSDEKVSFLKNVKILFKTREDVPHNFNGNAFPIVNSMSNSPSDTKSDTTPQQSIFNAPKQTKAKCRIPKTEKSPFKLIKKFSRN